MNDDIKLIKQFQLSPIFFIEKVWRLIPQPTKAEFKDQVEGLISDGRFDEIKAWHFENFQKGKHITWQQVLILRAIEKGIAGKGSKKISVVSGHGIGKDCALSWLTIWFLFCHLNAQVGGTGPTSDQIHDITWKEIKIWLDKMPPELSALYEWTGDYVRIKEKSETWFARARTAKKEAPEAMAGLHGDHVMLFATEASGVVDEVYKSAEGSLTGPNTLVLLIGNGTRNLGYFYDTHHSDKENWQTLQFSSEDSPVVEKDYISRMEAKYGRESDEFKIRVSGGFPSSEQMDDQGWIPLITEKQVNQVSDGLPFIGRKVLGIDPSGEGDDTTRWVLRDNFQARVVATEATSNEKSIARKTYDLIRDFEINPFDVVVDNFGVGANVKAELLLLDHSMNINAVNWGEEADDEEVYLNKRAECCFRGREWIVRGGAVVGDELKRDIINFPYKNNLGGRKQIMDKPKLKQRLGRSPDRGDAFFLTFYQAVNLGKQQPTSQSTRNDLHSSI